MNRYDVVVIGGGAAGLSAGLVLARARRTVAVVDAGAPRNAPAAHMQGFLSRDGLPPQDLLALGRDEVTAYGGTLIDGSVAAATRCADSGFEVRLDNGSVLTARRLLVATGLHDVLPDIPGVRERWGRDLLHCPYCHGYEVRDQPLGVLGGTAEAVQHAQLIRQWSSDVVLFPHTDALTAQQREQLAAREIGVVEGTVQRLVVEDDQLTGVELETAESSAELRCSCVPGSCRARTCSSAWAATWTTTAGCGQTPWAAPRCRASRSPATWPTRAPRSSPPREKDPPPRSP